MRIYQCDRCGDTLGSHINELSLVGKTKLLKDYLTLSTERYDICDKCVSDLKDFLNDYK